MASIRKNVIVVTKKAKIKLFVMGVIEMNPLERKTIEIKAIKIGKRFRKDIGNLNDLKNSIKDIGLIQPIVLDDKTNLVAGLRRIEALKQMGEKHAPIVCIPIKDIIKGQIHENTIRKDFTISEIVAIKREIVKKLGRPKKSIQIEPLSGKTYKLISKYTGKSIGNIWKAEKIVEAAEKYKDKFHKKILEDVDKNSKSVDAGYRLVIQAERSNIKIKLPKEQYNLVTCDVPFEFDRKLRGSSTEHYKTYKVDEFLNEFPKEKMPFAKDCILCIWEWTSTRKEIEKIIDTWGFTIKSEMIWVKMKNGKLQIGMGERLRICHEKLLFCEKGKPPLPLTKNRPPSVLIFPRNGHSEKPLFHKIIKKMYPNLKALALFERQNIPGWETFGDEIKK